MTEPLTPPTPTAEPPTLKAAEAPDTTTASSRFDDSRISEKRADTEFAAAFKPMPARPTLGAILDAILKTPARVVHEIVNGNRGRVTAMLLLTATVAQLYTETNFYEYTWRALSRQSRRHTL